MDAGTQEKLATANKARVAGDYDTALGLYRAVLDVDSTCVDAIHGLALSRMWGSGEFEEGIEMLEQAASLAPESQKVLLDLGMSHSMLGEDDKARPLFEKVVALDATTKEGLEAQKQLAY